MEELPIEREGAIKLREGERKRGGRGEIPSPVLRTSTAAEEKKGRGGMDAFAFGFARCRKRGGRRG